jgi:hypothetical protein
MAKRIRRAYLKPYLVTTKPKNQGLSKEGMSSLYNNVQNPGHALAFSELASKFAIKNEKQFNTIKRLMEIRVRLLEKNIKNFRIKEQLLWVTLQECKYFKLVLFWNTGPGRYSFISYRQDLISISKPYLSRASAMDAYEHRDIFWLDFIRLST